MNSNSSGNAAYVLYYGLSGYPVTVFYLIINILTLIVALVSTVLNSVTINILLGKRFQEDIVCIFISHQAASDLLSSILLIYNIIYNLLVYQLHFVECAVRYGLVNGVFMASFIIIFTLTFERYLKIMLPLKYCLILTPRRSKGFMICSWIFSLAFSQTAMMGWSQNRSNHYCRYFDVFTSEFMLIYCGIMFTLLVFVILMYGHILYIALKQNIQIEKFDQFDTNRRHKHIWWRPTKTALIIVGVNVLCWLPSGIYILIATSDYLNHMSIEQKGTILTYVSSVLYLTCIANPIIYACKIEKVSRAIRKMFNLSHKNTYVTEYIVKPESPVH